MSDLTPDFVAWAESRPWWPIALEMVGIGVTVHVRDPTFPPWPHSVPLSFVGHEYGAIVMEGTRRNYWTLRTREGWVK